MNRLVAAWGMLLVVAVTACGDDGDASSGGGTCERVECDPHGATGVGGGDGGGGGGEADGGAGGGVSECGLTPVANDEFCAAGAAPIDCAALAPGDEVALCGIALPLPAAGAGDATCFDPASYPPPPGTPATTRLQGFVRIAGNGCQSSDVTIQVFPVSADGAVGPQIGTSATTPASCTNVGDPTSNDACDTRWECAYLYPNVPTETALAVKTSGPTWTDTIAYGLYITNAAAASGAFAYDARAIAVDDYGVLAQAALGAPVADGHGTILGEVLDCAASPVGGAVVGAGPDVRPATYLTSDPHVLLPDLTAKWTGPLGRFAIVDVKSGPARVAAVGAANGEVVALGFQNVGVIPDGITWITFAGLPPWQVPAP